MKHITSKLLSLLLCLAMLMSMVPAAYAAGTEGTDVTEANGGASEQAAATTDAAKVGETGYTTLAAALDNAQDGATVTLLADVTENVIIKAVKNMILDLNGHTLSGGTTAGKAALTNYGRLTINDSSEAQTGTIKREDENTGGYYVIDNKGTMTINGGNVINNSSKKGSSLIRNGGAEDDNAYPTLNITGGTFTQLNFIAIKNDALSRLNVSGGKITSNASAIQNWYEATITGGEINGQLWTDAFAWDGGESTGNTTISENAKFNGEIVMDITGKNVVPKLNISGGDLNITNWRITPAASAVGAKPAVSGGMFSTAVPEAYCADGFIPTKNEDGTYGVKVDTSVAEVNGVKYETLQEAIDAAPRKATVKLLADTKENVTISTPYMTLDLNGFTLNGGTEKGKPALTITARVTVKDSSAAQTGTIMREDTADNSGVSSHYVIDVQGAGWLTFESGKVTNNSGNTAGKGASLVRVGDDSVAKYPGLNIKGGTFTQDNFIVIKVDRGDLFLNGGTLNSANSYAVENWHRATIKGGTVNGNVSSWTYSSGLNSELTINGGTVNGNVESVSYDGAEGKLAKVAITGGTVNGTLSTKRYGEEAAPSKDMATIEVTGGTFSSDPTKYVVENSSVTKNGDGTFGVAKAYLAQVGETSYYTMDEAFKAQTASGKPIVLLRDYTTGSPFNSGSINRTVDLNGHTWTCTGTDANSAAFEINYANASLTVKNGKIVSSQLVGLIPSASGGTIKYDNSSLTFENVEMSTTATSGIETNGNNTNDSVTLRNSTLNVPNGFGIYFPSSGTLTIDNSTINAKTMGVQVCAGSLSINAGSTITVSGGPVVKTENDGAIQDGAAISIVNRTGYKGLGDITVTGGTFTAKSGNAAIKAYDWQNQTESNFTASDKVSVSGGTFSSDVSEYCVSGYKTELTNGVYVVKAGTNDAINAIDEAIKAIDSSTTDVAAKVNKAITEVDSIPNETLSSNSSTMDKLAKLDEQVKKDPAKVEVKTDDEGAGIALSEVKNAALSASTTETAKQTITINVDPVTGNADSIVAAAKQKVTGAGENAKALDITMTKTVENGVTTTIDKPTAPVVLTFTLPTGWKNAQIVYVDGDKAELVKTTVSNGKISGVFNHFSTYVLVETEASKNPNEYEIILTPNTYDVSAGDTLTYTVSLKHTEGDGTEGMFTFVPDTTSGLLSDGKFTPETGLTNYQFGKDNGKDKLVLKELNLPKSGTKIIGTLSYTVQAYPHDNTKIEYTGTSEGTVSNEGRQVEATVRLINDKDVTYHVVKVTFSAADGTTTEGYVKYGESSPLYATLDALKIQDDTKKVTVPVLSTAEENGTGGTDYRVLDNEWHLSTDDTRTYPLASGIKTSVTFVENYVKLAKVTIPQDNNKNLVQITKKVTRTVGNDSYVDQSADLEFKLTDGAIPKPGMKYEVKVKVGGGEAFDPDGPGPDGTYKVEGTKITGNVEFVLTQKMALTADDIKIFTGTDTIGKETYRDYSTYSGKKTLVLIKGDAGAKYQFNTTSEQHPTIYKTNAYDGYNFGVLIDPTNVGADKASMLAYMVNVLGLNVVTSTEEINPTIEYDFNTNGLNGAPLADAQVTRDFIRKAAGNGWYWEPTDDLLLKADVITVGDGANPYDKNTYKGTADGRVSVDDLNAFMYLYVGMPKTN